MSQHPSTAENHLNIHVKHNKSFRRRVLQVGAGAGAIALASMMLPRCGGGFGTKTQAEVPQAAVFNVEPVGLDCRAVMQAAIVDTVSLAPKTPIDHAPLGIGSTMRSVEGSYRYTAIFTNARRTSNIPKAKQLLPGGVVATLFCAEATGVTVEGRPDGVHQVVRIPAESIKEFSAIDESSAVVLEDEGLMAALGTFTWSAAGGLARGMQSEVQYGKAALEALPRALAINTAQVQCADAAWQKHLIQESFTQAYRDIEQQRYNIAVQSGAHLVPFDANTLDVQIVGSEPKFEPQYVLPHKVTATINHGAGPVCTVAPDALNHGTFVDALGHPVPLGIGAYVPAPPLSSRAN